MKAMKPIRRIAYLIEYTKDNLSQQCVVVAYNRLVAELYFKHINPDVCFYNISIAAVGYLKPEIPYIQCPVTEEIIEKVRTDSDLYELSNELNIPIGIIDYITCNEREHGTSCYDCAFVTGKPRGNCRNCSRLMETKDNYKKVI